MSEDGIESNRAGVSSVIGFGSGTSLTVTLRSQSLPLRLALLSATGSPPVIMSTGALFFLFLRARFAFVLLVARGRGGTMNSSGPDRSGALDSSLLSPERRCAFFVAVRCFFSPLACLSRRASRRLRRGEGDGDSVHIPDKAESVERESVDTSTGSAEEACLALNSSGRSKLL